ncbi:YIP1 family protein [Chitinophaga flava]|uniref:Yip1 domain-containing protein n=1 Tax=Chitinophaga flava TaxID=2259036 RepID=A0A365XT83_9BACT|nr:YIP1 family protein [Chitinophaga flava]RBL88924.1 hypothetical protein DF182_20475 [Chitinophaga flava]
MTTWLFRPFTYIAGGKALLAGWIIMLITAVAAYFSGTHFDGAIDAHATWPAPYYHYLLEPLIAWLCTVIICYVAAKIFSKSSFRLIDLAGTLALARAPLLILALVNFAMPVVRTPADITPQAMAIGLIAAPFVGWMLVLLYQAFSISTNLKGNKAVIIFISALLVAEIVSKILPPLSLPLLH